MRRWKHERRWTALLMLLAAAALVSCDEPRPQSTPAAIVNGEPLPEKLLDVLLASRQGNADKTDAAARRAALDDLVLTEVLVQRARAQGLHEDPEFRYEAELLYKTLLAQRLVKRIMNETRVDDAAVQRRYDDMPAPQEYHVRHILLPDEAAARATIDALKRGRDFSQLAARSIDTNAAKDGSLGWLLREQLPPEFARVVETLPAGAYGTEPVHTERGWHVVKLEAKRELPKTPFSQAQAWIAEELRGERVREQLEALRREAKITILEPRTAPDPS